MGSLFCHLPIRLTLWSFSSHYVPPRLAGPRQHGPPYAARLPFHQDAAPHENMDTARSHLHAASLLRRGKGRASPTRFLRSPGSSTTTAPPCWPAATPLSIRGRPRLTPFSLAGSPLPPPPPPLPPPAVRRALGGLWGTFSAWRPLCSAPPTPPSRCIRRHRSTPRGLPPPHAYYPSLDLLMQVGSLSVSSNCAFAGITVTLCLIWSILAAHLP
jgi:hypothetical protein